MIDIERAERLLERGTIEVAPIAFMRGRTLNDAFVILDEAQNTTSEQMKMFLTRLGFGSKAVITGDITQIDLPIGPHLRPDRGAEGRRQRSKGSRSSTSTTRTSCATARAADREGLRSLRWESRCASDRTAPAGRRQRGRGRPVRAPGRPPGSRACPPGVPARWRRSGLRCPHPRVQTVIPPPRTGRRCDELPLRSMARLAPSTWRLAVARGATPRPRRSIGDIVIATVSARRRQSTPGTGTAPNSRCWRPRPAPLARLRSPRPDRRGRMARVEARLARRAG